MANGVLTFDQYIGGPDQVIIEQAFPSTQRSVIYDYSRDITGWTFSADYQTLVVDTISFNRYTGAPNFANSTIIGSFAKVDISGGPLQPVVVDSGLGTVKVTFPSGMYPGPIIPDARENIPIVIFSFTWNIAGNPAQILSNRWAFIQCYEPDVVIGNPTGYAGYTPLVL
jgi:hypothetical protein